MVSLTATSQHCRTAIGFLVYGPTDPFVMYAHELLSSMRKTRKMFLNEIINCPSRVRQCVGTPPGIMTPSHLSPRFETLR